MVIVPYLLLGAALVTAQAETPGGLGAAPQHDQNAADLAAPSADESPEQPIAVTVPLPPSPASPAVVPPPATPPDRWFLAKLYQGTWPGICLDTHRMAVSGWLDASVTASTTSVTNEPMTWSDRANRFLVQQAWTRFEQTVVTNGTTEPTCGFRVDLLAGTDYRFTMARGLWNSQLLNSTGAQNLYGVDLVQHYAEVYVPTVARGLDVKVGRFFCPFGVEGTEAINTPLLSRSFNFNASPFTHLGGLATLTLDPCWTIQAGLINGNDVWIDRSEEARFVGTLKYVQPGGRNAVTFGTLVGRGKLNAGDAFAPATVGTQFEPAGRNNFNVFDLVYMHVVNPRLTYNLELTYAYETNVPANVAGGIITADKSEGKAEWLAAVHYLNFSFRPELGGVVRLEFFEDPQGQRTGFVGLYTAVTTGLQFKLHRLPSGTPQVLIRPELRYNYNGASRPFEDKHDLFTAATDVILRW
jgi:hypothetical protein